MFQLQISRCLSGMLVGIEQINAKRWFAQAFVSARPLFGNADHLEQKLYETFIAFMLILSSILNIYCFLLIE